MKPKLFWLIFGLILLFFLTLHLYLIRDNNFYFTMDQGRDAVYAREILRGQFLFKGPETSIHGFYNGPIWFYLTALGQLLTGGHPIGILLILILINVLTTAYLMRMIATHVSKEMGLVTGLLLTLFWPFFDMSRYAFNPFLLGSISLCFILFLTEALLFKKKYFIAAAIPLGLILHSEVATFPPFVLLYILTAIYLLWKKRIDGTTILMSMAVFVLFLTPHIISELQTDLSQFKAIQNHLTSEKTVFHESNFPKLVSVFTAYMLESLVPQSLIGSGIFVGILVLVIALFYVRKSAELIRWRLFTRQFVVLSTLLVLFSLIWFGSSTGWSPWHTPYISSLLFVSFILLISSLPKYAARPLLIILCAAQLAFFGMRYKENVYPTPDASLLHNELKAVDWVYEKSENKGFSVYSYLPSVQDYPYQYILWWRGTQKFGYVPCEYSTYPGIPDLFVPGVDHYQEPKRECEQVRYLIVEPDKNEGLRNQWLDNLRKDTELIEKTNIGTVLVEKRRMVQ